MEIRYHGKNAFYLKGKEVSLAINPERESGGLKADLVLSSNENPEMKGQISTLDWPGEYEVRGVPVMGIPAYTKSLGDEEENGAKGDETIIFYFELDGIKICHLGKLGHKLSSEMVKELNNVDILLFPVGAGSNLDKRKSLDVLESIDPRIVIPMSEDQDFAMHLRELGAENIEAEDKFAIKSANELPVDVRKFVLLKNSLSP